ncbi:hypothetical protein GW17_00015401 [Ensete ventricosum]|nr:hypothetical protein GW17_00015401 [Ensete ventricosum]RZR90814.1 hypothetical protein BHM03_00018791 [Ensete ventricosum]
MNEFSIMCSGDGRTETAEHSHDLVRVPEDGIVVEIGGGIEPEVEPHFPADDAAVAASSHVHVRLQSVWLTRSCAEELDVHLVMEARLDRSSEVAISVRAIRLESTSYIDPRTWVVAWRRLGIDGLEHDEDKELKKKKKKKTTHLSLRKEE